ncbi:hypothetical protein FKM82_013922 [Ascaphus truei]
MRLGLFPPCGSGLSLPAAPPLTSCLLRLLPSLRASGLSLLRLRPFPKTPALRRSLLRRRPFHHLRLSASASAAPPSLPALAGPAAPSSPCALRPLPPCVSGLSHRPVRFTALRPLYPSLRLWPLPSVVASPLPVAPGAVSLPALKPGPSCSASVYLSLAPATSLCGSGLILPARSGLSPLATASPAPTAPACPSSRLWHSPPAAAPSAPAASGLSPPPASLPAALAVLPRAPACHRLRHSTYSLPWLVSSPFLWPLPPYWPLPPPQAPASPPLATFCPPCGSEPSTPMPSPPLWRASLPLHSYAPLRLTPIPPCCSGLSLSAALASPYLWPLPTCVLRLIPPTACSLLRSSPPLAAACPASLTH